MKKISVVIPSYNYAQFISTAIDSIVAQSYPDWELVIVDDGSKDGSIQVIEKYKQIYPEKITLIYHESHKNLGLVETYRLGFKKCSGEYVVLLEADDSLRPDSLEVRANILEKYQDVAVVFNDVEVVGDVSIPIIEKIIQDWRNHYCKVKNEPFYAMSSLLEKQITLTLSAVMTRKSFLSDLDYSIKHDAWFDWWLLAQLSLKGPFVYLPAKKTKWRRSRECYTSCYVKNKYKDSEAHYWDILFFMRDIRIYMEDYLKKKHSKMDHLFLSALKQAIKTSEHKYVWYLVKRFLRHLLSLAEKGLKDVELFYSRFHRLETKSRLARKPFENKSEEDMQNGS